MADTEDYASDASDSEAAMAAMMGFKTFGSKNPPTKKRKFNSATDAFVEGDDLSKLDKGGRKGQGSGGNEVPLGKTRVLGMRSRTENKEEISLDNEGGNEDGGVNVREGGEDEEGDDDAPRYMNTSLPPPAETGLGYNPRIMQLPGYQRTDLDTYKENNNNDNDEEEDDDDEDGPIYIDTSLPPPIEDTTGSAFLHSNITNTHLQNSAPPPPAVDDDEAREMQTRIDAILASIQPPPGEDSPNLSTSQTNPSTQVPPGVSIPSHISPSSFHTQTKPPGLPPGLPLKPSLHSDTHSNTSTSHRNNNVRGGSGGGRGASGRGERNPHWYIGYYDHSFNENPWEKLEVKLGLEPVGTWLKRPIGGAGRGRGGEGSGG